MYNKYFTMKKSELKEAIKKEIKSVLSEEIQVGDIVTLGGDGDELKVIDKRRMFGSDMMAYRVKKVDGTKFNANVDFPEIGDETVEYSSNQLRPARMMNEGTWSSGTYNEIGRFIQDVKNLKDKYYNIVGNDDVFDGLDRAEESAREMMIDAPENRSDLNEDEMSDEEKDKAASKEAKKKDSIATISNKLQKLTAKMKKKAKEFKEAEGKAKDKLKDELKDMTAEKKKLEKAL